MIIWWQRLQTVLAVHFLARWMLANLIGWVVGLYAGVLNPVCFAGAGVIAGVVLGAAQWWVLRPLHGEDRRWVWATFAGAALGMIPASLLGGLTFLLVGYGGMTLVAGAILGGGVAAAQWWWCRLYWGDSAEDAEDVTITPQGMRWIGMSVAGGALCGVLSSLPFRLPLGLVVGALCFGYLTGRVLLRDQTPT